MSDQQEHGQQQPAQPEAFAAQFAKAPRWQQIVLVGIFVAGILSGVYLLLEPYIKPRQYPPYVARIESIAARLQQASDTGDVAGAVALYDPVTGLLHSIPKEPDVQDGSRRYCLVAIMALAKTMDQVVDGMRWDRSTFDNAMRECKK